jgi:hypothetical protein
MKEISAYKCGYCKRIYQFQRNAQKHEAVCHYNPSMRSCFTCGLFVREADISDYDGEFVPSARCEKGFDIDEPFDHIRLAQVGCKFWEPRENHPGEYVKFRTGFGGYRKLYEESKK